MELFGLPTILLFGPVSLEDLAVMHHDALTATRRAPTSGAPVRRARARCLLHI